MYLNEYLRLFVSLQRSNIFWISLILIVCVYHNINIHDLDFFDAYPNPVLVRYISKCFDTVNKCLCFWFSSDRYSNKKFISVCNICAPLAQAHKHRIHQWNHWGGPDSCKWGARAAQAFVAVACTAPARQSCFAAAPANRSLKKGKGAASSTGGCNAMKGLTIMSCPARPRGARTKLPENDKALFFMGPSRGWKLTWNQNVLT